MNNRAKFRQFLNDGTFHYWGYIDGHFASPASKNYLHVCFIDDQQNTDIIDKNSNYIYEGDIIKFRFGRDYDTGEVYYDKGYGQYMLKCKKAVTRPLADVISNIPSYCGEIIGNIFDRV